MGGSIASVAVVNLLNGDNSCAEAARIKNFIVSSKAVQAWFFFVHVVRHTGQVRNASAYVRVLTTGLVRYIGTADGNTLAFDGGLGSKILGGGSRRGSSCCHFHTGPFVHPVPLPLLLVTGIANRYAAAALIVLVMVDDFGTPSVVFSQDFAFFRSGDIGEVFADGAIFVDSCSTPSAYFFTTNDPVKQNKYQHFNICHVTRWRAETCVFWVARQRMCVIGGGTLR